MDLSTGNDAGRTAYRDPSVPQRVVSLAYQSLRPNLLSGERVLALFASTRLGRSVWSSS